MTIPHDQQSPPAIDDERCVHGALEFPEGPQPSDHPFVRPGQVAPDRPAPDACMVRAQPEAAHRTASPGGPKSGRAVISGLDLDLRILARHLCGHQGRDLDVAIRAIDRMTAALEELRDHVAGERVLDGYDEDKD